MARSHHTRVYLSAATKDASPHQQRHHSSSDSKSNNSSATRSLMSRQRSFSTEERVHHPFHRNGRRSNYVSNVLGAMRARGTIVIKILPLVLAVCLESLMIVVLHRYMDLPVYFDDRMITMLGSGIALLLAFRTNRGFERYNGGAQLWTNMTTCVRNLARTVWTGVVVVRAEDEAEKMSVMRMILAVAIATKHSLRGCPDPLNTEDVELLLPDGNGNQSLSPLSPSSLSSTTSSSQRIYQPKPLWTRESRRGADRGTVLNGPLKILSALTTYARNQRKNGRVEADECSQLFSNLAATADAVAKFEQLLYVPVPLSYDVHIKQVLMLYFISLPFQLVRAHGWATIFVAFVGSLTFFGTDAIASEISDPFGSDLYDLPLDYFCKKLKDDMEFAMDGQALLDARMEQQLYGEKDVGGGDGDFYVLPHEPVDDVF